MFDLSWTEATFWVAAVACAVAQVAIVRSVFVARQPEGGDVPRPAPARRAPEVAWAVVPALALAAVLVLTWRAVHAPAARDAAAPSAAPEAPSPRAAATVPTAAPGAAEV